MAGKLWVREIRKNKILRDVVVPCERGEWSQGLVAACHELDIGAPILVVRHERDFSEFGQARFLPEHFMEPVAFDRLEAEYFDPDEKKEKRT